MNLLIFLIILFSFYTLDFKKIFFLSFIFGLLSDLIFGNWLGVSSLLFLAVVFLVYLYRRKFSSSHLLFQLSFLILVEILVNLIKQQNLSGKSLLIISLTGLLILPILNTIKGKNTNLELEVK